MRNPLHTLVATYRARIDDASMLDELCDLYAEIVGYDPVADDPSLDVNSVRYLLDGYVDEMATNYGV